MFYDYKCPICSKIVTKDCLVAERNELVECSNCQVRMNRLISVPAVTVKRYGGYNYSLGIVEKDKNSVKDHLKKTYENTGTRIVEVGNDSLQSVKIKHQAYKAGRV